MSNRITLFDNIITVYLVHSVTLEVLIKGIWWLFALLTLYLTQNIYWKMVLSFFLYGDLSATVVQLVSVCLAWRKLGVRIPATTDINDKNSSTTKCSTHGASVAGPT